MIQLVKVLDEIFGVHVGDIRFNLELPHAGRVQYRLVDNSALEEPCYCHGLFEISLTFETMQPLPKNNFGSIILSPFGSSKVCALCTEADGFRTIEENTRYQYIARLLKGEETNSIVSAIAQDILGK